MNRDEIVGSLVDAHICDPSEIAGMSADEVTAFEREIGLVLPYQYREFLQAIGHGADGFFRGTDIFLSAIHDLRNEAVNLLKENQETFELPANAVVFSMHQGYEFTFFLTSDGEDPPVYQYVEGSGSPELVWKSFSCFLSDAIVQHTKRP